MILKDISVGSITPNV